MAVECPGPCSALSNSTGIDRWFCATGYDRFLCKFVDRQGFDRPILVKSAQSECLVLCWRDLDDHRFHELIFTRFYLFSILMNTSSVFSRYLLFLFGILLVGSFYLPSRYEIPY